MTIDPEPNKHAVEAGSKQLPTATDSNASSSNASCPATATGLKYYTSSSEDNRSFRITLMQSKHTSGGNSRCGKGLRIVSVGGTQLFAPPYPISTIIQLAHSLVPDGDHCCPGFYIFMRDLINRLKKIIIIIIKIKYIKIQTSTSLLPSISS